MERTIERLKFIRITYYLLTHQWPYHQLSKHRLPTKHGQQACWHITSKIPKYSPWRSIFILNSLLVVYSIFTYVGYMLLLSSFVVNALAIAAIFRLDIFPPGPQRTKWVQPGSAFLTSFNLANEDFDRE